MISDLWKTLTGAGIALDREEAAALGAPAGETISVWAAMSARHGSAVGHLACLGLWLVQARHCSDTLEGVPMTRWNYVKAMILLVCFAPAVALIWAIRSTIRLQQRAT